MKTYLYVIVITLLVFSISILLFQGNFGVMQSRNAEKMWQELEAIDLYPEINKKNLAENLDIKASGKSRYFNLNPFFSKLDIVEPTKVRKISENKYYIELMNKRGGYPGETMCYLTIIFNGNKIKGELSIKNRSVATDFNTVTRTNDFGGRYYDNKVSSYKILASVNFSGVVEIKNEDYIINLDVVDKENKQSRKFSIQKEGRKINLYRGFK